MAAEGAAPVGGQQTNSPPDRLLQPVNYRKEKNEKTKNVIQSKRPSDDCRYRVTPVLGGDGFGQRVHISFGPAG
jgi:hypothetical protein